MTVTHFGFDYEGIQSVKITKGDIDAGMEPDSNVGSFLYNSKWTKDYKLAGIDLMQQVGSATFWPSGAGYSNFTKYTESIGSSSVSQATYFRNGHFPDLAYDLPLADTKAKRISNGRFVGSLIAETTAYYDRRGGQWTTSNRNWWGWGTGMTVNFNSSSSFISAGAFAQNAFSWPSGVLNEPTYNNLAVWNLPGNNVPILDGSPVVPIEGATVIQIDNSGVRVAKPGFDLNNITRPSQLAFDSARSPTKIIGAADIALPAGVTNYDIGVTIPPNAVADVYFYQGSTITFPGNPVSIVGSGRNDVTLYGSEYWFEGSQIRFNNQYGACRARFIIYANSTQGTTTGNNDVLRQFEVAGQNVVQVLRPGAGPSPTFADIVVDSRWPCIQILAEGHIPVGNGELAHTVNFNGAGCFPIIKWMTVHGGYSGPGGFVEAWGARVRAPFLNVCGNYNVGWQANIGGDTTYCTLTANQAIFRTFRGNPIARYYLNFADYNNNRVTYDYDPAPINGIRYYVLGIPA